MSFLIKTILISLAIVLMLPSREYAEQLPSTVVVKQEIALTPVQLADKYALQYGVNATVFKKVMKCESSNNPKAVGDHGKAKNVMQFHKPTFDTYSKKLGKELIYDSAEDQIELAAWMFSKGQQGHWTCYKTVTRA